MSWWKLSELRLTQRQSESEWDRFEIREVFVRPGLAWLGLGCHIKSTRYLSPFMAVNLFVAADLEFEWKCGGGGRAGGGGGLAHHRHILV